MQKDIFNKEKIEILKKEISVERTRLSTDRMDISFGEIINLYKNKELIIRPEYQRLYRWTIAQKTALIESILLGIPIPPIFVAEDKDGIWELVDGLQRVATFISFFGDLKDDVNKLKYEKSEDEEEIIDIENKWELKEGFLLKNLSGFNIDNLPSRYKMNLKRATCRVEILRGESNTHMKYELFKRLNSGGSRLTPQEIRNAIYREINPRLNDLVVELSQNKKFIELTNLTKQKKSELYDQELVLRFIAFYNNVLKVNDNMEKYLNLFMEKNVKNETFNYDYKNIFEKTINLLYKIGDKFIFRNDMKQNIFTPVYLEGIMIGVSQNIDFYIDDINFLKEKINELKKDEDFKKFSGRFSNSKNRIRDRLTRANNIFSCKNK